MISNSIAASQNESTEQEYIVDYQFETNCDRLKLIRILYDFSHLVRFMTDVDRLEVAAQTPTSYHVTYNYKYLFYRSRLVFKKTLREKENTVDFSLLSAWDNVFFLPELVDVRGYWRVAPGGGPNRWVVHYHQRSVFDDELGFIYRVILEKRSKKFLHSLKRYLEEEQCRF